MMDYLRRLYTYSCAANLNAQQLAGEGLLYRVETKTVACCGCDFSIINTGDLSSSSIVRLHQRHSPGCEAPSWDDNNATAATLRLTEFVARNPPHAVESEGATREEHAVGLPSGALQTDACDLNESEVLSSPRDAQVRSSNGFVGSIVSLLAISSLTARPNAERDSREPSGEPGDGVARLRSDRSERPRRNLDHSTERFTEDTDTGSGRLEGSSTDLSLHSDEDEAKLDLDEAISAHGLGAGGYTEGPWSQSEGQDALDRAREFREAQANLGYDPRGAIRSVPDNPLQADAVARTDETCRICLDRQIDTVLFPCGHYGCCFECASGLTVCPFCRKPIDWPLRVYRQ